MVWFCLRCGRKNLQEAAKCSKCDLEKELAQSFAVIKRLRMCEECGHIHREGYYCHVYTEAADKEMVDDVVSDSEGEEEEESDSDNSSVGGKNIKNAKSTKVQAKSRAAIAKAKAKAAKARTMKIRPLATPDYVKAIGYLRCNCKEGVPMDCLKYEPVPQMVMVDIIQIQTYVEIMDPGEKTRYWSQVASKRTETAKSKKKLDEANSVANNLPRILSYLHYGQCWAAAVVSRSWNAGANVYKEYVDIRNFVPYQVSP
ncbi:hypothetical protein EON65_06765 [archaeon]|nr:MAG: hypothetical protein EON65_06765 [archaeon]